MRSPVPIVLCCGGLLSVLGSATCDQLGDTLRSADVWRRHTIDDSSGGADGARIADADHDGLMDVVVAWEDSGEVKAYLNPGVSGARGRWPGVVVGRVPSVEDAVFVDLDDDGATDVISCAEGRESGIWVHWAPADPQRFGDPSAWSSEPLPAARNAGEWMFCLPLQLDGAAGIDVVAGAKGSNAQIGWFEAPEDPRNLGAWRWHRIADSGWTMSLFGLDVDGDGDVDVVTSDRKGDRRGVWWLENPGTGPARALPWRSHRVDRGSQEVMFMDVADLDDDGAVDVLVATSGHQLTLHRCSDGACGTWQSSVIALPASTGTGKSVRIADVDLDGLMDVVFSCEGAGERIGVGWLSYVGDPQNPLWRLHPISGTAGAKFDLVQVLDLDGDGDLDVITTEEKTGLGLIWYENPWTAP